MKVEVIVALTVLAVVVMIVIRSLWASFVASRNRTFINITNGERYFIIKEGQDSLGNSNYLICEEQSTGNWFIFDKDMFFSKFINIKEYEAR